MNKLTVEISHAGQRLDRVLAQLLPDFSRSRLQTLIRDGFVTVNGKAARPRDSVRGGNVIEWREPEVTKIESQPEAMDLEILFEDDDLLVINKPAGLVVHPGAGHQQHTLVNALLAHCKNLSVIGGKERPGIVHRLDKETSGVLVVAKNDATHRDLSKQFADRTTGKTYLALVAGQPRKSFGTIDAPIARHPVHRQRMSIARRGGRAARTDYRVLDSTGKLSLVECVIHSGRTHQIRIHLHHLGHPVLGDKLYGGKRAGNFPRQMLHAWKLTFRHPRTSESLSFTAPIPNDFKEAMPA
ncbi:MAG TPA: RluA family pseudouridine synthase [Chthoniobacterales bacterium]|nr:RluA family pseudouridine synthase [Chthoniobacterales bacterium]